MRALLLLLILLAIAVPVNADSHHVRCDMPQTIEDAIWCMTYNTDSPASSTTHASASVIAAGCEVMDIQGHASAKGPFTYTWSVWAGGDSSEGNDALLISELARDGDFILDEGESVTAGGSIQNDVLGFDRAAFSIQWTCTDGELVERLLEWILP